MTYFWKTEKTDFMWSPTNTLHILSRKKFQAQSYSKNADIENLLLLYFQSRSSSSATSSASKPDPEDEEESDGEEPSPRRSNKSK